MFNHATSFCLFLSIFLCQAKIRCANHSSNSSGQNCNNLTETPMIPEQPAPPATHISVFICLGFLGAAIVLANSVVLYLYKRKTFLKTKTNLCLVCLAISDFLAGLIAVPMVIVCSTLDADAVTSGMICTVMDLSSRFISISTVLHLLLVTMERYFKIIHALNYPLIVTKFRLITLLALVWCVSLGTSLIQLTWIPFGGPSTDAEILAKDTIYNLSVFFAVVIPSLLMMFVALSCIFRVLRSQLRSMKENGYKTRAYKNKSTRLEAKAVTVFGSMIVTFIACWFSYYIDGLLIDLKLPSLYLPEWARTVLVFLRFGSSVLNPLLYTFFKEDFRRALLSSITGSSYRHSIGMTTMNCSTL